MKRKIAIGITGASGAIYAKVLLDCLVKMPDAIERVAVVMSDNAKDVWRLELKDESFNQYPFDFYGQNDFMSPIASGSARYDTLIVCPCSMGTMARIATGVSNDLMTRAADVVLKERRKLILVARDTPFSLIHINNMKTITEAGGIICPANPSFYSGPSSFYELAATVVHRALDLADLPVSTYRWADNK